jgi:hypothetical protein
MQNIIETRLAKNTVRGFGWSDSPMYPAIGPPLIPENEDRVTQLIRLAFNDSEIKLAVETQVSYRLFDCLLEELRLTE